MDPVTQAALGAAVARVGARTGPDVPHRSAASVSLLVAGAAGGLAPDLDVLIRSATDPLLFLEYHRQFTHALVFIPFGGALVALALWPVLRRWLGPAAVLAAATLGYASHGVLDACTSYGTALLWPFSDARVAWNLVSVIDPLLTLPLVVAVLIGLRGDPRWSALFGVAWVLAYLGVGAWQGARAEAAALALARDRGHAPEQLTVKPSFANLMLWKSIYAADGRWWVDAVRAGADVHVIAGEQIVMLDVPQQLPWLRPASRQAVDLARFERFSAGYLAADPARAGRILDVRYSMVPNRIDALWGITLTPDAGADEPAQFWTHRTAAPEDRAALMALLRHPPR
ncbi:MAG: metal-dependent hydrolase [Gammaproteobacteria bacterium]